MHSTFRLASAFACASQFALASQLASAMHLGGSKSPSHLPLQDTEAIAFPSHLAWASAVQATSGPETLHSPLQVPVQEAPTSLSIVQVPWHSPLQ